MNEKTRMQLTAETGSDFWNDSCSVGHLTEAVQQGAVGATSNPVIVHTVIAQEEQRWLPELQRLIAGNPRDTEEDIAAKLVACIGAAAARVLEPVYRREKGRKGRLSVQVNPRLYRDPERMFAYARGLAAIAPNIAVKAPCTEAGLEVVEEMTANGICPNVTVSFSVAQALTAAETIERGLDRAARSGIDISQYTPYVTIMVGRLDDHLKRVMAAQRLSIDPGYLEWAGVAVFKRAYELFRTRGYRSQLLSAAYRNHMHWSEFLGGKVVLSMPYEWWTRFNASDIEVVPRIDRPVDPRIVRELSAKFPDFVRAYEAEGMKPEEFVRFGPSIHTLNQFLGGYDSLLGLIRQRMLI
ncbi:MAG TPA: transaldolase family protein [Bacteroidota bacterium]